MPAAHEFRLTLLSVARSWSALPVCHHSKPRIKHRAFAALCRVSPILLNLLHAILIHSKERRGRE
jgi:hypothetical protein